MNPLPQTLDPEEGLCGAIKNRQMVTIVYRGEEAKVEPHAYGLDESGNKMLLLWSDNWPLMVQNPTVHDYWNLILFDPSKQKFTVHSDPSSAPRPEYYPSVLKEIICAVPEDKTDRRLTKIELLPPFNADNIGASICFEIIHKGDTIQIEKDDLPKLSVDTPISDLIKMAESKIRGG